MARTTIRSKSFLESCSPEHCGTWSSVSMGIQAFGRICAAILFASFAFTIMADQDFTSLMPCQLQTGYSSESSFSGMSTVGSFPLSTGVYAASLRRSLGGSGVRCDKKSSGMEGGDESMAEVLDDLVETEVVGEMIEEGEMLSEALDGLAEANDDEHALFEKAPSSHEDQVEDDAVVIVAGPGDGHPDLIAVGTGSPVAEDATDSPGTWRRQPVEEGKSASSDKETGGGGNNEAMTMQLLFGNSRPTGNSFGAYAIFSGQPSNLIDSYDREDHVDNDLEDAELEELLSRGDSEKQGVDSGKEAKFLEDVIEDMIGYGASEEGMLQSLHDDIFPDGSETDPEEELELEIVFEGFKPGRKVNDENSEFEEVLDSFKPTKRVIGEISELEEVTDGLKAARRVNDESSELEQVIGNFKPGRRINDESSELEEVLDSFKPTKRVTDEISELEEVADSFKAARRVNDDTSELEEVIGNFKPARRISDESSEFEEVLDSFKPARVPNQEGSGDSFENFKPARSRSHSSGAFAVSSGQYYGHDSTERMQTRNKFEGHPEREDGERAKLEGSPTDEEDVSEMLEAMMLDQVVDQMATDEERTPEVDLALDEAHGGESCDDLDTSEADFVDGDLKMLRVVPSEPMVLKLEHTPGAFAVPFDLQLHRGLSDYDRCEIDGEIDADSDSYRGSAKEKAEFGKLRDMLVLDDIMLVGMVGNMLEEDMEEAKYLSTISGNVDQGNDKAKFLHVVPTDNSETKNYCGAYAVPSGERYIRECYFKGIDDGSGHSSEDKLVEEVEEDELILDGLDDGESQTEVYFDLDEPELELIESPLEVSSSEHYNSDSSWPNKRSYGAYAATPEPGRNYGYGQMDDEAYEEGLTDSQQVDLFSVDPAVKDEIVSGEMTKELMDALEEVEDQEREGDSQDEEALEEMLSFGLGQGQQTNSGEDEMMLAQMMDGMMDMGSQEGGNDTDGKSEMESIVEFLNDSGMVQQSGRADGAYAFAPSRSTWHNRPLMPQQRQGVAINKDACQRPDTADESQSSADSRGSRFSLQLGDESEINFQPVRQSAYSVLDEFADGLILDSALDESLYNDARIIGEGLASKLADDVNAASDLSIPFQTTKERAASNPLEIFSVIVPSNQEDQVQVEEEPDLKLLFGNSFGAFATTAGRARGHEKIATPTEPTSRGMEWSKLSEDGPSLEDRPVSKDAVAEALGEFLLETLLSDSPTPTVEEQQSGQDFEIQALEAALHGLQESSGDNDNDNGQRYPAMSCSEDSTPSFYAADDDATDSSLGNLLPFVLSRASDDGSGSMNEEQEELDDLAVAMFDQDDFVQAFFEQPDAESQDVTVIETSSMYVISGEEEAPLVDCSEGLFEMDYPSVFGDIDMTDADAVFFVETSTEMTLVWNDDSDIQDDVEPTDMVIVNADEYRPVHPKLSAGERIREPVAQYSSPPEYLCEEIGDASEDNEEDNFNVDDIERLLDALLQLVDEIECCESSESDDLRSPLTNNRRSVAENGDPAAYLPSLHDKSDPPGPNPTDVYDLLKLLQALL